jgi:hypothetical protein
MKQLKTFLVGIASALLTIALGGQPAAANDLTDGYLYANCSAYTVTADAVNLSKRVQYSASYNILLSCVTPQGVSTAPSAAGTFTIVHPGSTTGSGSATGSWAPPLNGSCTVSSATATLQASGSTVDLTPVLSQNPLMCGPPPCTGTIGDFVWNDTNGNGIQDAGEPGIAGVGLSLKNSAGSVVATATTNGAGGYSFTGLCAGTYTVTVTAPPANLTPTICTNGSSSGTDSNCSPATVNLPGNNSTDLTIDFGYVAPPAACSATASNASNFNGTTIPGGDYIWFNANFTAKGIPNTGATVTFTSSTITLNGQTLTVPSATIIFSSVYSCVSTTFDSATNAFVTTAPLGGSDEIFLTGLAYPVPSGFAKNETPVWTGTFGSSTPGVSMNWKWGAAVYTSFSTNYTSVAPLAAHGNACAAGGGDHAGTPEGGGFKAYVIGGARGGGGSNWTGSWSGTAGVTPVCH